MGVDDRKTTEADSSFLSRLSHKLRDFFSAFADLLRLPRAFWFIILVFMIDSIAYFGMLNLMTLYMPKDIGIPDQYASIIVSLFTMFVTAFMIGVGGIAEGLGVRRALILCMALMTVARACYSGLPLYLSGALLTTMTIAALLLIAVGEGIIQPVSYAGIKYYTDEKTSSMGYGLIYALMNLGIVMSAPLSKYTRVPTDKAIKTLSNDGDVSGWSGWWAEHTTSGLMAANWVFTGVTALGLIVLLVLLTQKAESQRLRFDEKAKQEADDLKASRTWRQRLIAYFSEGPFTNRRFIFFIFMLFPVQTLFAHQWLTMPAYMTRAFSSKVADNMEMLNQTINPMIIVMGVPIATALTRRANVYTMMIIGSLVSAVPTFLLSTGPSLHMLITYLVLFSIGEALWQPRFLQYAAELAPEGKVAQYM
ncbi:MAG: MFS transporter, partial [Phycisphaerae bacterium]